MKKTKKIRADEHLVRAELAGDIEEARALLMSGQVIASVEGKERKVEKAGDLLPDGATFRVRDKSRRYVSRAGEKLEAALERFQIPVEGRVCADVGLSTGGFTDCLLKRGATRVHGVDVGYGDVAWSIRNDPRVVLWERTNARKLDPAHFGELVSLVVVDVSFISLTAILPALVKQLTVDGEVVALVKPQFEAAKEEAPGGVVRDPAVRRRAVDRVLAAARAAGLTPSGEVESPLLGADGNVEILVRLRRTG